MFSFYNNNIAIIYQFLAAGFYAPAKVSSLYTLHYLGQYYLLAENDQIQIMISFYRNIVYQKYDDMFIFNYKS
jgi:hypothetical protein